MEKKKVLMGAAIAGLLVASCASPATTKTQTAALKGECNGVNACKGTGECGGAGHSCAGKNACKGQGWITLTQAECEKQGGTFKTN